MTTTAIPIARGTGTSRELYCGGCGYGIVVRREPPSCPMCRANAWSRRPSEARWN
jgi:rubrerythrin